MKRIFVIILAICMLLTSCSPLPMIMSAESNSQEQFMAATAVLQNTNTLSSIQAMEYTQNDFYNRPYEPAYDYPFLAPSVDWGQWVAGQAPATFSPDKISYTLADDVVKVDSGITKHIASAGQLMSGSMKQLQPPNQIIANGGYIRQNILDAAVAKTGGVIKNGTVVVDESTGTAFKVVSPTIFTGLFQADEQLKEMIKPLEGTYGLTTPQLHEILKDFTLEEDTIQLTRANISGFAPNIERNICLPKPEDNYADIRTLGSGDEFNVDMEKGFKYISNQSLLALKFEKVRLDATVSNTKIAVTVTGGLGIDNIELTGRYSSFGGYEIGLSLKQECYLIIELDAEVHEEIRIPLLAIDVPFLIGRVSGGLYAIVGMDGDIRLDIAMREWTPAQVGVSGGTSFCVPTSVTPHIYQDIKCDGNVQLAAKINGYMKFGPMVSLEVFGLDLVGTGVLLGTGVSVVKEGAYLDVTLYAILNVYVSFLGKIYNLANFRPAILNRRQTDTAGLIIKFQEVFLHPKRAGGTIQKEPDKSGAPYEPAGNVEYRIWVVPKNINVDLNNPSTFNQIGIEKYPKTGYARTNAWGEFIQYPDGEALRSKSKVYLELKWEGKTYYSDPVIPTLPFDKMTISYADYYNHYVTGRIQPIRTLNWEDGVPELTYALSYYDHKPVFVHPYTSTSYNYHQPYGGSTVTQTDETGYFDTRIPLNAPKAVLGYIPDTSHFEVPGMSEDYVSANGFDLTVFYNEETVHARVKFQSGMSMSFSRVLNVVEGSYKRYEENGKIIDSMQYDEHIWIFNNNGTRTPTDEEFRYHMKVFSTQDYSKDEKYYDEVGYYVAFPDSWERDFSQPGMRKLTPILDESGKPTGAALFSQRVTVEWVWQAHPNPVKITSPNHVEVDTNGGSFDIKADGYGLIKYTLIGAPAGVSLTQQQGFVIGNNGHMVIPGGLISPGTYKFTIRAEENRDIMFSFADDLYKGHDPSPPDEQEFTLTVRGIIIPPDQPPLPTPPAIAQEKHGYVFEINVNEQGLTVPVTATGSTPIIWSLIQTGSNPLSEHILMESHTGVLTVKSDIPVGTYYFTIRAVNVAGSDTQECRLTVRDTRTAPVISEEGHGYVFSMTAGGQGLTVPVTATGSTPITWALVPTGSYPLSEYIHIDSQTGILSANQGIYVGTHYFTIQATNDVGNDTKACSLTVTEQTAPPLIIREGQGYDFIKYLDGETLNIQINASGSTPIYWSLIPTGENPLPQAVRINSETGVLSIGPDIALGKYYFTIKAENAYGSDKQECSLTVVEATAPPKIAQEPHGYQFEKSLGSSIMNIQINASGSTPISWSLIPTGENPLPQAVWINAETGVLTIGADIEIGKYYFTIKAENVVGSDTQECSLIVTDPRTPPKIAREAHGYQFIKYSDGNRMDIQINASGSTPIYWSLIPTGRYPLPEGVWINSETGLLTIGPDVALGKYYFTIKAENAVGSDTQACSLEVKIRNFIDEPTRPPMSGRSGGTDIPGRPVISVSADNKYSMYTSQPQAYSFSGSEFSPSFVLPEFHQIGEAWDAMYCVPGSFAIDKAVYERIPPNAVTIRWDDPKDVYTDDRWTHNGAMFIRWNAFPGVGVGPGTPNAFGVSYSGGGMGTEFTDYSPRCDNYHYDSAAYAEDLAAKRLRDTLINGLSDMCDDHNNNRTSKALWIDGTGMTEKLEFFPNGQTVGPVTYLESGPLLDQMSARKIGLFKLELDEFTGTMITGRHFVRLQENPGARLAFIQDGATVTFAGKDITTAYNLTLFDFGYYKGAFNREEILASAGPDGEHFTFAFAYHGELPGMAEFSIATGMTEGTKVNIYKYDPETGIFTLIAGDVTVGRDGIVTYRNNTMSEYLITTKTLEDAKISDVADMQSPEGVNIWLFISIGLAVLLCAAAVLLIVFYRKRPKKAK